jgi:hypothetical protein
MSKASNSMIGDHKYFLKEKFSNSKAAGKPWQIFVGGESLFYVISNEYE